MPIKIPTFEEFSQYDGAHCRKLWLEVGDNWICPACNRNKFQIFRWTTRFPHKPNPFKGWMAGLNSHHDHSLDFRVTGARFPDTIICDQCNIVEGGVKRRLKIPEDFSFSPQEMALFIAATPHGNHKIDYDLARSIFQQTYTPYIRFF